ncbi:MAG: polysaccharide biosynthesis C-terminal domain-containing protein [Candidatus Aenigmarchaeota archaeon]|nr:polysaccharide biosynthesis C-terminal domain-containing protein [Candidatus Aenigmarchaeota archaeon]
MGSLTRILSNTFYLSLDWVALTLGGYIYWILMSKMLSVADIGQFSTISNTALFLAGISGLGMNVAVTKLFPEYQIKNKTDSIPPSISWTLKITTLATVLIGAILILLSRTVSHEIFSQYNVLFIAAMAVLTNFLYMTSGYLFGLQKMKEIFKSDVILTLLKVGLTVPLIIYGFGYLGPVYSFLAAAAIATLLRWKWLPRGGGQPDRKKLWFYSIPVLVSSAGTTMINQGSVVLLSLFSTPINVGIFSILFYITSPVRMIPQLISNGMFPTMSQKWAANDTDQIQKIVSKAVKYSTFIVIPLIISLSIFSKEIVILLTTPDYLSISNMFFFMSLAYMFSGMSTIFTNILYSSGDVKSFRNSNLVGGFLNLVIGAIAIVKFGVAGAVAGFLLSNFSMLVFSFYLIRKKVKLPVNNSNLFKLVLSCSIFVMVSRTAANNPDPFVWAPSIVLAFLIYASSLVVLGFFDKLDLRIIEELEKRSTGRGKNIVGKMVSFLQKFAN